MGVGHGHDALVALLDGLTRSAVGVDPYIDSHGNDGEDFARLMELRKHCGLASAFHIERESIESFLVKNVEAFDHIICNDVLHHIFESEILLSRSPLFPSATSLFERLWDIAKPDAELLISDVGRHGARPWLRRCGMMSGNVDYGTKQPWKESNFAATHAGWQLEMVRNYIPFPLRNFGGPLTGAIGRFTLCERYILKYRRLV